MPIGPNGDNLVFLISQPRSGSTLLQRMLAVNNAIHTASEPWLMLHPLYALREVGYTAEYNAVHAYHALQTMFTNTPEGEQAYYNGVRMMYGHLYNRILGEGEATHFLDKTPRYYLVIEEIARTFPQARFIFLHRNPLAVLCSLITTWAPEGRLYHLERWRNDLHHAPQLMLKGAQVIGERGLTIRYEDILADPQLHLKNICEHIGITYDPQMVNYGRHKLPEWNFGDKKSVYKDDKPDAQNAERWTASLKDAQMWRICDEYLRDLGETTDALGYPHQQLRETLDANKPSDYSTMWTQSLRWLEQPAGGPLLRLRYGWIRFCHLARTRGPWQALIETFKYMTGTRTVDAGAGADRAATAENAGSKQ